MLGTPQKHGRIIVLNGASSSGKTATAQALQKLLGKQTICTGLDDLLDRIQPFGPENGSIVNMLVRDLRIMWFQLIDGRVRLFKQLHREVVEHAKTGHDIIVETALMNRRVLQDAAQCFVPLDALFVAMKPPLAVSEQWEAERKDRPLGHARKHYDLIHAHGIYDLIIDSSKFTPDECAVAILRRLDEGQPDAFRRLLEQ